MHTIINKHIIIKHQSNKAQHISFPMIKHKSNMYLSMIRHDDTYWQKIDMNPQVNLANNHKPSKVRRVKPHHNYNIITNNYINATMATSICTCDSDQATQHIQIMT